MDGTLLKSWREQRGLTQAKLAEMLGLNTWTVAAWEQGRQQPAGNTVVQAAALLDEYLAAAALVEAALDRVGSPDRWIPKVPIDEIRERFEARDADGNQVDPWSERAARWTGMAALESALHESLPTEVGQLDHPLFNAYGKAVDSYIAGMKEVLTTLPAGANVRPFTHQQTLAALQYARDRCARVADGTFDWGAEFLRHSRLGP